MHGSINPNFHINLKTGMRKIPTLKIPEKYSTVKRSILFSLSPTKL